MTDGSSPGLTPQELRAAADTRRGATRSTSKFLYLDEEAQEQFLQEKRRRQGTRTAAESQSARRAEMQSMVLIRADGSRTSLVTSGLIHETLDA